MRLLLSLSLAVTLSGIGIGFSTTTAEAQRYRVACVAPGAPACRTACGSNTHAVYCHAYINNAGRCVRYCGRPR